MRVRLNVRGVVQGVGFRPFIYRVATSNRLSGHVRNLGDAGVEILLEGHDNNIRRFLQDLEEKKPPLAEIYEIKTRKLQGGTQFRDFTIQRSSTEAEQSGSVIPPDIAICSQCLSELRHHEDRRYDYFFITCTDCGPRYTIINRLPYDRENTSMRDFDMCPFCQDQYSDPRDRRFHAQTVACPVCGPQAYLATRKGDSINHKDPIRQAGRLLEEGDILAIKGYGGFHIATATTKDAPLMRLRKAKYRSGKPFAIMAKDLPTIKAFAEISPDEARLLSSYARPIVLLDKRHDCNLSDLIAPGLHNIGVMLPYTGLHYMLFDKVSEPAFVMTSANPPNQPIAKDNQTAMQTLGDIVDYFLFHNREIVHRCDDSVIRLHGKRKAFIRRSRGYSPAPIHLKRNAKRCIAAVGGELNNTACILLGNKAFISQHIGDVENVETRGFLSNSMKHLIHLTNSKIEAITCDLHPKFITTRLAQDLAEENDWRLLQVQHHHAHVAGLMAEHNVDEIIGICCDGYGYGLDGEAWGGEILLCLQGDPAFKRLAHLDKQPLAGGDLATRYPLRTAAAILHNDVDIESWLQRHQAHFPHGEEEIQLILHQLKTGYGIVETTSCGRVLDAIAAVLGICYERTYEGEPSMKLESAAIRGKDVLKMEPMIENDSLNTTQLVKEIFEKNTKYRKENLAYSAHVYLAKGLAKLGIEKAQENKVKTVGFSGGVAYNAIFTLIMRRIVESAGLRFLVHEAVPPGDGGLSFGQASAAGFS